jgi:hypothetical protein
LPGTAVGAGGAITDGENVFGPDGMRGAFSVGLTDCEGDGAVVAVVGAVVVVVGAFSFALAQDEVKPTIARIAAPPAIAAIPRTTRSDVMVSVLSLRVKNCSRLGQ